MFGFPESPSEWGSKEYLRLFTIVMFYISVRPIIQALYQKLGERQRAREKKQTDDELIQRHKQERVRDKLGIEPLEEIEPHVEKKQESSVTSSLRNRREAREAKKKQEKSYKEKIIEEMPSDEDVSDLVS